jgi:Kef-type K+ transport system membrane component KefB
MTSFLVPLFFTGRVSDGHVAIGSPALLAFAAALSIAAVVGKWICDRVVDHVSRLTVAVGMIPREEVFVFAALGSTLRFGRRRCSTNGATRQS